MIYNHLILQMVPKPSKKDKDNPFRGVPVLSFFLFLGVWLAHATNSLQSSYNLINLPAQIKSGSTVKANYTYLSDGTSSYAVDYHITYHLGSVRAILAADGDPAHTIVFSLLVNNCTAPGRVVTDAIDAIITAIAAENGN